MDEPAAVAATSLAASQRDPNGSGIAHEDVSVWNNYLAWRVCARGWFDKLPCAALMGCAKMAHEAGLATSGAAEKAVAAKVHVRIISSACCTKYWGFAIRMRPPMGIGE